MTTLDETVEQTKELPWEAFLSLACDPEKIKSLLAKRGLMVQAGMRQFDELDQMAYMVAKRMGWLDG